MIAASLSGQRRDVPPGEDGPFDGNGVMSVWMESSSMELIVSGEARPRLRYHLRKQWECTPYDLRRSGALDGSDRTGARGGAVEEILRNSSYKKAPKSRRATRAQGTRTTMSTRIEHAHAGMQDTTRHATSVF